MKVNKISKFKHMSIVGLHSNHSCFCVISHDVGANFVVTKYPLDYSKFLLNDHMKFLITSKSEHRYWYSTMTDFFV